MTLSFFSSISNDTRLLSLLDMMYNDAQDRLARFIVEGDLLNYVRKLGSDWRHFSSATSFCSRARRRFVHSESPEYEFRFFDFTFWGLIFTVCIIILHKHPCVFFIFQITNNRY